MPKTSVEGSIYPHGTDILPFPGNHPSTLLGIYPSCHPVKISDVSRIRYALGFGGYIFAKPFLSDTIVNLTFTPGFSYMIKLTG